MWRRRSVTPRCLLAEPKLLCRYAGVHLVYAVSSCPSNWLVLPMLTTCVTLFLKLARYKDSYALKLKEREDLLRDSGFYPIVQPSQYVDLI